ncbi:RagB/SusD family nutrient uptake outer membrane protein [Aureitalea sp. L0-47]|uniref:RagB/SusD family nutrient uptake outer membrane protein n=1 Tax=Aureitalea sp. L0-47 TaxID=2816962 RepID=UPI002237F8B9|nr:RagB/SusD family nutrient uptake outer membrane protein [Aureitalea sp. L0-47]MCW5518680.1 RagB/SusD family nutrient uptake outer membrane protein [Aureitalea sp. L0-47]
MKKTFLNYLKAIFAIALLSTIAVSCTDLELEESDSIILEDTDEGFAGVADVGASLDQLYNDLRGQLENQADFFALNEVSTDETLVPTRGTDWGDNGIWRTLHTHSWSPSHQYLLAVWNNLNQNVFRATQIIDQRSAPSPEEKAQAQFLRAYSMFFILDFWGKAPFREVDEGSEIDPRVLSAQETYDFILNDLTEARQNLPSVGPGGANDKASKAAANFMLAKLYLNADRYVGSANYQGVIDAVDAIAAEGYALESINYFDIFKSDTDSETIWWVPASVGNRMWNGLHYNQVAPDNTGGGWNGFSTLAEFYDSFEGDPNSNYVGDAGDDRRGWVPDASNAGPDNLGIGYGFLIGQQYDVDGRPLSNRSGQPLSFTKELTGISGNAEEKGIRLIKYHPVNGSFAGHQIIMRYADAHLMKAEAMLRLGGDPTAMVNELRGLRNTSTLGSVSENDLLAERGRELWYEFWRRNDLIRFGQYTRDWDYKLPESVGADFRNLYPIPTTALLSNPNLEQNEGY